MGAIGRFQFVPRTIEGSMTGATQAMPTGSPNYALFYEIIDGMGEANSLGYVSGAGDGKKVGIIAYDFVNARWSCLFTVPGVSSTHANTTYFDDQGEIKAFIATLPTPTVTDEVGDDIPWPASFAPLNS